LTAAAERRPTGAFRSRVGSSANGRVHCTPFPPHIPVRGGTTHRLAINPDGIHMHVDRRHLELDTKDGFKIDTGPRHRAYIAFPGGGPLCVKVCGLTASDAVSE
jgi:hypothetical protein